jgi:glutamyl-tRNA reductase
MRVEANEPIETWIERVRNYELTRALHQLTIGKNPETISGEMSQRITNKLNHYIITRIKLNS